ncbi:MAG: sugar phosphate isomerase/epimerase [Kiritimatiellae bacterium]|nr:sugar phosphate isomerase/epimerase [Kiritimatiellia bacterium]
MRNPKTNYRRALTTKLATTTADLRSYAKTPAEIVGLFAGTGFKRLDMDFYGTPFVASRDNWKQLVGDAGEAAARIGVKFCQAHAPDGEHFVPGEKRDALVTATQRSIEACAMLGIKDIVVHAAGSAAFTPCEFMKRNRDFYSELFDTMEKFGVNALVENGCEINTPFYYLRTGAEIKEFLEFVNHPLLHACWDTGHAHMRGMDQYESIIALGGELHAIHIADNYGDRDSHTAPFFGSCNFDPVMQGLLDIKYGGAFTFEGSNLMRNHDAWPHFRKPWEHCGKTVTALLDVPLHIKQQAVALMYATGKYILEQYGCFEY